MGLGSQVFEEGPRSSRLAMRSRVAEEEKVLGQNGPQRKYLIPKASME